MPLPHTPKVGVGPVWGMARLGHGNRSSHSSGQNPARSRRIRNRAFPLVQRVGGLAGNRTGFCHGNGSAQGDQCCSLGDRTHDSGIALPKVTEGKD